MKLCAIVRGVIGLGAVAVASLLYWDVSRKYLDFADRYCGEAEAGGNCRALQALVVDNGTPFFIAAMIALAVLILLPGPQYRGK
jgi:hypothetical protein